MSDHRLTAAVLAGGQSKRMGRDKALLTLEGQSFLKRLVGELSGKAPVIVSLADHSQDIFLEGIDKAQADEELKAGEELKADEKRQADEERQADGKLQVVYDAIQGIGPMEGICRVLQAADTDYVFVCAVDMPHVSADLLSCMAGYISSDYDAYVLADEEHIHPLCAIYSKKLLPVIEACIREGDYRLRDVLKKCRTKYIDLGLSAFAPKVVRNVNTRAEYKQLLPRPVFTVSGYKHSGKTYLIEKLINEFIQAGCSVGVIKHDGHEFSCDVEGTDTARLYEAGAGRVAVYDHSHAFIHMRGGYSVESLLEAMQDVDVVILEGEKTSPYPKVWVGDVDPPPETDASTIVCAAMEHPGERAYPVYDRNDIRGIFLCLKKALSLGE